MEQRTGLGDTFLVRHSTSLDDLQWIQQLATEEGWQTRARDAECYSGIMRDFFIGELNGERISCISLIRHSEACVFAGYCMVLKDYRGKGYGERTRKAAFDEYVTDETTIQFIAVKHLVELYKRIGYQPFWAIRRYELPIKPRRAQSHFHYQVRKLS